jgi:serine protease Do
MRKGKRSMKKKIAAGLTGAVLVGALVIGQVAPSVFAEEGTTSLAISEIEASDSDTEEKTEVAEAKTHTKLETVTTDDVLVTAVDVSGVVEAVMPSIVKVTETGVQQMMDWFGQSAEYEVQGAASGFIIAQNDDELLIATNNHVVKDSTDVTVEFSVDAEDTDDLFVPAKVKGTDPRTDLAVIAVSLDDINEDVLKQLKIAVLGSSDNLKVGQAAITIGNTLGEGISVTSGIISALDVEITVEDGSTFTEFQTDGAANQGQSGGMIVNSKGEVIGIFNAGYLEGDNVGYGIPISTAIPVLQDLINRETRDALDEHGYIGITVTGVSSEAHELYNIPEGAYIYEVTKDSAGDNAGLEKGDIVVEFDGVPIDSQETLLKRVSYYAPGETLEIKVMRQGPGGYEEQTYEVTLDDAPKDMKNSRNQKKPEKNQETPEIPEGQENQDNQDGQDIPSIQFNGGDDNNESF